jgi:hypothetical protein
LRRSIQFVKFDSGILTEVFQFLAVKVQDMNAQEKECCLTLDEMSVTASVDFDIRSGNLIGDVNLPGHSGVATHALVFMLGGLTTRWKQPLLITLLTTRLMELYCLQLLLISSNVVMKLVLMLRQLLATWVVRIELCGRSWA